MGDKLDAIMNKLANSQSKKDDADTTENILPPTTVEEFIKAEKMIEWPFRLTSENPLDLDDEKRQYADQETIYNTLKTATSTDTTILTKLEDRLEDMYDKILRFADMIFIRDDAKEESTAITMKEDGSDNADEDEETPEGTESVTPSIKSARSPEMRNQAFMTDLPETDLQMVHPSKKAKKKLGIKESLVETKKKGVENCVFPGFQDGELTQLPGNIEAPQILNKVTSAASISSGFKKYWKKIFQSEASIAIMQDAFWWIFLEYFLEYFQHDRKADKFDPSEMILYTNLAKHKRKKAAQDQLFDRIADSFVALFVSIHPEVKDKFFKVYSDCLAQSIFVAFNEAFPESDQIFDREDFKQSLTSTLSEWVTGVRAPHGSWKKWPLEKLDLTPYQAPEEVQNGPKIDFTAMAKGLSFHLDMDSFVKTINKLEDQDHSHQADILVPSGVSFQLPKTTGQPTNTLAKFKHVVVPAGESHPIGRGPAVERVLFNLSGQSPLISHYQRMHSMNDIPAQDRYIKRTEIGKLPQTYRDLIEESQANAKAMHREYERLTETTNEEIAKIERQQRELARAIENLKEELKTTKNIPEVKHKSDQLFERGMSYLMDTKKP